jgi:hypothetical protein
MTTTNDVLVTVPQIAEQFGVSVGAVRAWVLSGRLQPVRREGRGRGGAMLLARGDAAAIVYGNCASCGNGFKRTTGKQRFCSQKCRQRFNRASKAGEP